MPLLSIIFLRISKNEQTNKRRFFASLERCRNNDIIPQYNIVDSFTPLDLWEWNHKVPRKYTYRHVVIRRYGDF